MGRSAQPMRAGGGGEPRAGAARARCRLLEPWEQRVLRLISEQQAIPFDQLARFLECEEEQAARVAKHLTKASTQTTAASSTRSRTGSG